MFTLRYLCTVFSSSNNREVTAFDFGGTKREASPELGFPADNHDNKDDDDGFGDFIGSRASSQASKPAPKINTQDAFDDFGDFKTSLPSPVVSNNVIPAVPPPPGMSSSKSKDLFSSPKTAVKQTHDDFDFFGVSASPAASKIAPPSGPSSPVANTGKTDIFGGDLFQTNPTFTNPSPAPLNV